MYPDIFLNELEKLMNRQIASCPNIKLPEEKRINVRNTQKQLFFNNWENIIGFCTYLKKEQLG